MTVALALLLLVPQVFYWGSQSPFLLTKAAYLYLVAPFACLMAALAWRRNPPPAGLPRALLASAIFVGYAAAHGPWFHAYRPEIATPFLWGSLLLVAWPTAVLVQAEPTTYPRYARAMVLLGGLTAAYAILQSLGVDLPIYHPEGRALAASFSVGAGYPPFATLGNPNFLGEYLAGLLPLAVAGAMTENGTIAWAMRGAAVLMATALPLTVARGAWLGAGAGLLVMFLLRPRPGSRGRRMVLLGLLVLLPSVVAAVTLEYLGTPIRPWEKLASTISQVTQAGEGRRLWWSATARMIADRPWAGVGEGNFREAYPPYQARVIASLPNPDGAAVNPTPVESPHNDYLHVAADLGIPGLLLLLGALGLIVRDGARAAEEAGGPERAVRAGSVGGLVAVLVAALFGYPLHTASGLFVASALAALAVARAPREGPSGASARWQWILLLGVTALGFWQAGHLLKVYAASLHLHRGTEAFLRKDLAGAIEALERAHQVSPRDSEIQVGLGRAYLAVGRPVLALPHLQAGLHGFDSAPLRSLLGRIYAALGQAREAEEMFRVGVSTFPGNPPLHLAYAAFLASRGRDTEASRELARALARDPGLTDAHYLLARVRDRAGDRAGAAAALKRFLALARPGDPRVPAAAEQLRALEEGSRHVDNGEKPVK